MFAIGSERQISFDDDDEKERENSLALFHMSEIRLSSN